jgi:hypothetical protein
MRRDGLIFRHRRHDGCFFHCHGSMQPREQVDRIVLVPFRRGREPVSCRRLSTKSNRMTRPPDRAHPALIRPPSPRHLPRLRHHRRRGNLSPGQILNRPFQLLFNHISLSRPRVAPHPFMQASTVPGLGNMELNSRSRNPTDGSSLWSWTLMNLRGTLSQAEPSNGSPIVKPARWACHAPGPLAIVTRSIVIPNPASGTTPSPVFSTS